MRTSALIAAATILLVLFFQCCPSAAPEAPRVEEISEGANPASRLTATPAPMGSSRDNPVPLNQTLTASNGGRITVHGIIARGEEATRFVKQWSSFNPDPEAGNEYVIISASVGYEGGRQETVRVYRHDFRAVVEGVIFQQPSVPSSDDVLKGEIFAGASIDGCLVFEVPEGSTGIVVIYTVPIDRSYYFATE
jgi:hypothetical protein